MFQETDGVCPWISLRVQNENKSLGEQRRPDHRLALSRSASPLQGKDAGDQPHTASGAEDRMLWCWGHKQTLGSMTQGLQNPQRTEERP